MAAKRLGLLKRTSNSILTVDESTASNELGMLEWVIDTDTGLKCYRYVQTGSTVANGTVLVDSSTYQRTVTTTITNARNKPSGVGIGVITSGNYGWIQCYGYHSAVKTNGDDDIAVGDTIIVANSTGVADSVASGTASTFKPIGVAMAADVDAADTVAVFINCI